MQRRPVQAPARPVDRPAAKGAPAPKGAPATKAAPAPQANHDIDDRQEAILKALEDTEKWYDPNTEVRDKRAKVAMELVSACPGTVHKVCQCLVKALAVRAAGVAVHVAGRSFKSREDLKMECHEILWRYPEDGVLEAEDTRLLLDLLSHHPRGQEKLKGCRAMAIGLHPTHNIRCFFVVREQGKEDFSYLRCVDNVPSVEIGFKHEICRVLCAILELHPAACERLTRDIDEKYPQIQGPNATVEQHRCWAQSLLYLCSHVKQVTEFLLMVLIRQMVDMDSTIQKLEEKLPDASMFEEKYDEVGFDRVAQILDATMLLMFEFMQRRLSGNVGEDEQQLAKCLLSVFEGTVLLTHRVRCVQFLWFYLASLRPAWAEAFLSVLLQTAYSPAHGVPKRLISFAYLASFVSRAQFLPTKYALRTAQYIVNFARESLPVAEAHIRDGHDGTHVKVLFLASVQAVCYILCFWADSFAQEGQSLTSLLHTGDAEVSAQAFMPVLESPCQPLTRISPHVAREFCRTISPHQPQLALALKKQLREAEHEDVETVDDEQVPVGTAVVLDSFFPFDPYRLRHSSIFLLEIYRKWVAPADDNESDAEGPNDGFQADVRPRVGSQSGSDDEASDADFTDAADVAERGFVPSVGPSPAFHPRSSTDMVDFSPLVAPMETTEEDTDFALPQACVDAGSTVLDSLLRTPAYKAGKAVAA